MGTTLRIQLQPKQKEAFRLSLVTPVTFYGGAKGGGKSYLIRAREVYRRLNHPKSKGLIIRKTYPELLSNHIRKFFEEYPETVNWYNKSEKVINWPNGSITEFSYLKNTEDVFTYQGREYEDISPDELTQHQEIVFKILRTSLRTTSAGISPTIFCTGNPGGPGHQWVKRLFVERRFKPEESAEDYAFVQARVDDNFALMSADPGYKKRLEDLPDHLRRAYLEGDWNIFAGQMFPELTAYRHLIAPITLPPGTRYFAGYDYGFNHPFAFVLCAITPDGQMYVVSSLSGRFVEPQDQWKQIKELCADKGKVIVFTGHDLFSDRTGKTVYDQILDAGARSSQIVFTRASIDRIQGVAELRKVFSLSHGEPQLKFFFNTQPVLDCVSSMQIDNKKPEDVIKQDAIEGEGGDDFYDAVRYAVRSWSRPQALQPITPENAMMRRLEDHMKKKSMQSRGWL